MSSRRGGAKRGFANLGSPRSLLPASKGAHAIHFVSNIMYGYIGCLGFRINAAYLLIVFSYCRYVLGDVLCFLLSVQQQL